MPPMPPQLELKQRNLARSPSGKTPQMMDPPPPSL
jgi:hypothetical protein